jgi:hypothetical protein
MPAPLSREPDDGFGVFPPRFRFSEQKLANYGVEGEQVPERPADLASRGNETSFNGMGVTVDDIPELEMRNGYFEVKAIRDGATVLAGRVSGAAPGRDFVPVRYLLIVTPVGLLGEPQPVANSEPENEMLLLQDYLARTERLGERLSPGAYLVVVGP